jgi:hypothetical protein
MNLYSIAVNAANKSVGQQEQTSILRKKHREDKDRSEWALVSKKGGKVLKWFGQEKPSEDRVKKEEQRIQYFKHKNGSEELNHMVPILASTFDYMTNSFFNITQQSVPMDRENLDIIWNTITATNDLIDKLDSPESTCLNC